MSNFLFFAAAGGGGKGDAFGHLPQREFLVKREEVPSPAYLNKIMGKNAKNRCALCY